MTVRVIKTYCSIRPKNISLEGSIRPENISLEGSIRPENISLEGSIRPKNISLEGYTDMVQSISSKSVPLRF